ncbi:MAG: CPBP family intramembrane metalloprotease [Clostridia bacterium]|nr:CPBP family intramembrane metalloprotease [Clostridia bacterium]
MENSVNENFTEVNPRLNSQSGGFAYSAATVFYFAVAFIASIIFIVAKIKSGTDAYLYISYLVSPVAISACVATTLKVRKVKFKEVFPVKCHPKYYVIGLLLIFGLLFSLSWINVVSLKFFRLFGYKPREGGYLPNLSGGLVVPALLVIAVLPALFEETLFRGVILNCCEKSMGSIRTVFVVGFCFSLFHGSPEQTVYQFIAGCAFTFLAVRSRSILPSVMMHFINNAIIVIFGACNLYNEAGNLIMSPVANIILIVFSACALVGGLVWLILDKTPLKKCEKGGVKNFFIFASVGIAIMGLTWILSLFGVS